MLWQCNDARKVIDGTAALAIGGWHHVAVTLNGATGTGSISCDERVDCSDSE